MATTRLRGDCEFAAKRCTGQSKMSRCRLEGAVDDCSLKRLFEVNRSRTAIELAFFVFYRSEFTYTSH